MGKTFYDMKLDFFHAGFFSFDEVLNFFNENAIDDEEGGWFINYPPSFHFPMHAKNYDDLFELYLQFILDTVDDSSILNILND